MRFFQNIKKYHGYAVYAAKAQLKSEVASSYLNWIWWILEPLLTMVVYIIVFGYFFQALENQFAIFLFIGILMWNFFSAVVKSSTSIVRVNRQIVSKVYVPKYILLISKMYQFACRFGFGLLVEIVMMILFQVPFGWHMLHAVPFIMGFFLFTFSCASVLIHFGVYIYDLNYAVSILLSFIMYLSGIFYSIEGRVPGLIGEMLGTVNPVAFYIAAVRNILIDGKIPSYFWLFIWCMISVCISAIGIWLVHRNENNYAKVI